MATKTIKLDDLDGKTEGAETIRLQVGDTAVDIDLAPANVVKLQAVVQPYFEKGREVVKKSGGNGGGDTAKIREWLRANGHEIGDKGRIPEDKQALYDAAHPQA